MSRWKGWPLAALLAALIMSGGAWASAGFGGKAPAPAPAQVVQAAPAPARVANAAQPKAPAQAAPLADEEPTPTATTGAAPRTAPEPTPTTEAASEAPGGPTVIPTPTARPAGTPWRVGLQVGHWKTEELPDELASLRGSTGTRWGDVTEAELNMQIVDQVRPLLEAAGVVVDVLPATVPPSYDADAFLAIHADGSSSQGNRGWKLATPWRASTASKQLLAAVAGAYGPTTGLPEDVGGVTVNMRGYYAFSYRRYVHAIARTTPAIIVEMGFMTNAADREVLFNQQGQVARGIADGVLAYLAQRDPNDGAALLPPEFPAMRAKPGAILRAGPDDGAAAIAELTPDDRIFVFSLENGWYEGFVRGSRGRLIGYVREEMLEPVAEPAPEPTPASS